MPARAWPGILASTHEDIALTVTQTFPPNPPTDDTHTIAPSASIEAMVAPNDTDVVEAVIDDAAALGEADRSAAQDRVIEDEPLQPDWQALPPRAHTVFRYVSLMSTSIPAAIVSLILYGRFNTHPIIWIAIGGVFAAAIAFGLWLAYRRYRYTFWKLDRDGFAVKRGRLWQWETRIPTTRVQHMDLKRGPLERTHQLASVILHTAGTRLSAVSVSGMDHHDAERLRDYLTRQIERQDGDDSEHA